MARRLPALPFLFATALLWLLAAAGCQSESSGPASGNPSDSTIVADSSANTAATTPRYSWKIEPGYSWKIKSMETTTIVLNPGAGNESRSSSNVTINRKVNLREIDKEMAMNLSLTYQDIVKQEGEGGKPAKGSPTASDPDDPRLNKTLSMRMEPLTGLVLEVKGAELIFNEDGMEEQAELADALYREALNDELYVYPDGPIEVGDTWQRSGRLRLPYGIKAMHTYTLDKEMNQQGFIKRVTEFREGDKVPGMAVTYSLNGTATADFNVDQATGLVFSKVANTTLEGTMTKGGKTTPIRIEISSISEMTLQ